MRSHRYVFVYKTAVLIPTLCRVLFVGSVLENESTRLSAVEFKLFITSGLKNLFGEVSPSKVHPFSHTSLDSQSSLSSEFSFLVLVCFT